MTDLTPVIHAEAEDDPLVYHLREAAGLLRLQGMDEAPALALLDAALAHCREHHYARPHPYMDGVGLCRSCGRRSDDEMHDGQPAWYWRGDRRVCIPPRED